jgi:hypothetical protein
MYALVGLSFLFAYGFLDRGKPELDVPPVHIAKIAPSQLQYSPKIDYINLSANLPSGQSFSSSITGTNFNQETVVWVSIIPSSSWSRNVSDYGTVRDFSTQAFFANSKRTPLVLTSISDSTPSSWRLPSIGVPGSRVVFSQGPSAGTWSLLETCLKLLLLFQGVAGIVNSSLATVFALIAYNRGKVDLKVKELDLELKRLQILQLQEQLERQARERQKEFETAAGANIVLIS